MPNRPAPDDTSRIRPPPWAAIAAHAGRVTLRWPPICEAITGSVDLGGVVGERRLAHHARVVDHRVDPAPGVERGRDDRLSALGRGDRVDAGHGLAARGHDLVDDVECGVAGRGVAGAVGVGDRRRRGR